MVKINDDTEVILEGRIAVFTTPDPDKLTAFSDQADLLFEGDNIVVSSARDVIVNLLRGNFQEYAPAYICVGAGGDYSQDTRLDTGQRVAPQPTDVEMRVLSYRIPISYTENGNNKYEWSFVAVARPEEAVTPLLNEFGVVTRNNTMISHYVTAADNEGQSTRYVKTQLEYLVVKWTYTLKLLINGAPINDASTVGLVLRILLADGTVVNSSVAETLAGAATPLAFSVVLSDGGAGTVDIQPDNTINVTDSAGYNARLILQVVE